MKTAAVIAEFNPFHNGHDFLFGEIRKRIGPDGGLVVVMSGSFTQRGEPALLDKWTRTRAALRNGADLVLELPFAYATGGAGRFASGGVALAEATGVCGQLAFGSESGELGPLQATADLLAAEPAGFRERLRARLDLGEPFAGARIGALEDTLRIDPPPEGGFHRPDPNCLRSSNNILAVEYLIAIRRQQAGLEPVAIRRRGASYHDIALDSPAASASAIRAAVRQANGNVASLLHALQDQMPASSLALLCAAISDGRAPVFPEDLEASVLGLLRTLPPEILSRFAGMDEGLHARLAECAARLPEGAGAERSLYESLLDCAATRRYASTRLRRALTAMLAGLTREDLERFDAAGPGPRYLRVLGFGKRGRRVLRIMRNRARLPIVMNASDFLEYGGDPVFQRMAALDVAATDLWMLARKIPCGRDFDTPPVMV